MSVGIQGIQVGIPSIPTSVFPVTPRASSQYYQVYSLSVPLEIHPPTACIITHHLTPDISIFCVFPYVYSQYSHTNIPIRKSCKNEYVTFLCFFSFFFTTITAEECLINCFCEEHRAGCTLFSCTDEINTEYDEVVNHGTLCQSHRYTLSHIIQDTLIILKDDICGEILNCQ